MGVFNGFSGEKGMVIQKSIVIRHILHFHCLFL